ncbi:MAG TPA: M20/M25/M40 family metallo-hydrolase [Pirellulales bacterium]
MESQAFEFFKQLVETPSPSGYEEQIQAVVRRYAETFADRVTTDVHGNVTAAVNPQANLRVMLAGHCDQVGLVVHYIDENGFLFVDAAGGVDPLTLIGQRVFVWTANGPRAGLISRKSAVLMSPDELAVAPKLHELWIDIGARNADEALAWVRIGDAVTTHLSLTELPAGLAFGPAMDDKAGLWAVLEATRRAKLTGGLQVAVFAVSTVQEEIGLRGAQTSAYGIDPHVAVAVDLAHATDHPTINRRKLGDFRVDAGPILYRGASMNPHVARRLYDAAHARQIPVQAGAIGPPSATDVKVLQVTREGIATGLVGLACRYMHSPVELISLRDMDRAADLLAEFLLQLPPDANFIPS